MPPTARSALSCYHAAPPAAAALLAFGLAAPGTVPAAGPVAAVGAATQVSAPGRRAMAPDIAVGRDGTIHVLYVEKSPPPPADPAHGDHAGPNHHATDDLWYRRSGDGGRSFSVPVRVNSAGGEVWGFAVSKPELDIGPDGTVHVTYPANAIQESSGKGNLVARYTRSADGRAFEPARTLNSPATNDLSSVLHGGFASAHAFGTLVADPAGGVHVFWIDTRLMTPTDGSGALFATSSRDGGRTFAPDVALSRVDVCPCCQLAAAATGNRLYLSSRQTFEGGFRDSAIQVSTDGGRNFGNWVRLGEGRWEIAGCPLKRTAVAARNDDVYTAWFTAGQDPAGVWFARSIDGGRTYGTSVLLHPGAAVSDAPSVVSPDGDTVLVAWHGKTGGDRRVFLRVSTDRGASFGPVAEAPAPAGSAAYPELATGGGRIALVWQQDDAVYVAPVAL